MPREDMKSINHNDKPPVNDKRRKCKVCGGILSRYNLNKYCFAHSLDGSKQEQQDQQDKARARAKQEQLKRKREKSDFQRRHRDDRA